MQAYVSNDEFMPPYQRVVNGREVANPIDFGWGDKIAPRIGAAWDVTGTANGSSAAASGYSMTS